MKIKKTELHNGPSSHVNWDQLASRVLTSTELLLFDNLEAHLSPKDVEKIFKIKVSTIYDWKHRGHLRKVNPIPYDLFIEDFGGKKISLRTEVLKRWFVSKNLKRLLKGRSILEVNDVNSQSFIGRRFSSLGS